MSEYIDSSKVFDACRGRWLDVLSAVSPSLADAARRPGHHCACPVHGGHDGFRFFPNSQDMGNAVCNTCSNYGGRTDGVDLKDGFATLAWAENIPWIEAVRRVANYLGGTFQVPADAPRIPTVQAVQDPAKIIQSLDKHWDNALPMGHPRAAQLRQYLTMRGIPDQGAFDDVRFLPACYYAINKKEGEPADRRGDYPAIICLAREPDGKRVTVQRTYLSRDGRPSQAEVCDPKKSMSYLKDRRNYNESAVYLDRPLPVMSYSEGLENCLSARAIGGQGIGAAFMFGQGQLAAVTPAPNLRLALIWADDDYTINHQTGEVKLGTGLQSANAAAERLQGFGVQAIVLPPPSDTTPGRKGADWNDALRQFGVEALRHYGPIKEALAAAREVLARERYSVAA